MPDVESNQGRTTSRAVHLVLVAVIGLSFVGFFVGIRQGTPPHDFQARERTPPQEFADTVPAMSYAEFDRRRFGPNRQWRSALTEIDQGNAPPPQARFMGRGVRESYLAERADRRAYDGAPPTVPHPIEQMSTTECLACHAQATYVGKNIYAPAMSHELMPNCTQCHIERESYAFDSFLKVENTFDGMMRIERGFRVWSAAPPRVPHTIVLRENCLSCHGPAGAQAIRTDHPWDSVCLQCHIPASMHDQFARPGTLRPLGHIDSILNQLDSADSVDQ
jgi:nitrate reductase (cytochrome), electron transfer subunit